MVGFNFDFNEHRNQYDAMICIGEEERDLFSEILAENKRNWCSGESYITKKHETRGTDGGCIFAFNDGTYWSFRDRFEDGYKKGQYGEKLFFSDYYKGLKEIEFAFDDLFE